MTPAEQKAVALNVEAIMKTERWPGRRAMAKQLTRFGFDQLLLDLAHDGHLNREGVEAQVERIDAAWEAIRSQTSTQQAEADLPTKLKEERRRFGTELVRGYDGFRRVALGLAEVADVNYDPSTERNASRLEAHVNARVR